MHTVYTCVSVYIHIDLIITDDGVNVGDEVIIFGTIQTFSFVLVIFITQHTFPLWSTGASHKSGGA